MSDGKKSVEVPSDVIDMRKKQAELERRITYIELRLGIIRTEDDHADRA